MLLFFNPIHALRTGDHVKEVKAAVARCGLAFLELSGSAYTVDENPVADALITVLSWPYEHDPRPVAQAWVRLAELGYFGDDRHVDGWPSWPDLTERLFVATRRIRKRAPRART